VGAGPSQTTKENRMELTNKMQTAMSVVLRAAETAIIELKDTSLTFGDMKNLQKMFLVGSIHKCPLCQASKQKSTDLVDCNKCPLNSKSQYHHGFSCTTVPGYGEWRKAIGYYNLGFYDSPQFGHAGFPPKTYKPSINRRKKMICALKKLTRNALVRAGENGWVME
jgi:hypothetical protein